MPKMKTTKSVVSRFKVTGTGKILRRKVGQRHKHLSKRRTNLRRGKEPIEVLGFMKTKVRKMMGI